MAITVMGGLFAATFLTLLFLPALYAFWFRRRIRDDQRLEAERLAAKTATPADIPAETGNVMALPRAAE